MAIKIRPLVQILGRIIKLPVGEYLDPTTLGSGTADGTTYLRGDGTWQSPPSGGGGILKGTASGTDTYTTTITGVTSYTDGDAYLIRFTNGNTTGCTLNINSLGAKTLYRNNDGPLIGGDILDGAEMLCIYNSSLNAFQAIGTSPNTLLAYVTNADSVTITKGQPVYAFGGTGDRLRVKLAHNSSDATSAQTVGLVLSSSIGVNQKGLIIVNGLLDGLSILPTSTWSDGDPVYLGSTAGTITKTKPHAPNHLVYLGFVTTASNGSAGRLYVRVQNGYELNEIHDVDLITTPPVSGNVLSYNGTLWVPGTGLTDGDKGDITVSSSGTVWTIDNLAVTDAKINDVDGSKVTQSASYRLVTDTEKSTWNGKLTPNAPITGATKTKITYDSNGLVTAGADASTADIADSTNKRYVTDAQLTVIGNTSGTNTGDQTSIVGISGTKSQFDTACSDGNFLYVGDVVGLTDGDKGDITVSSSGTVWNIDAATIGITELSATGTPSATTFLRGDNTWSSVTAADPEGWTTIVKSANQDVTGSTLTDDTELQFSVVAGGYYMVELHIAALSSSSVDDYRFRFSVSTGNIPGAGNAISVNAAAAAANTSLYTISTATPNVPVVGFGGGYPANTNPVSATANFSFRASANATFSMQFATNTGTTSTAKTMAGSILKYKRIL